MFCDSLRLRNACWRLVKRPMKAFHCQRSTFRYAWPFARWLVFCIVIAAMLAWGKLSLASNGQQWPLARGDAQSQAVSTSKMAEQPALLWEVAIESTAFESTPIIVDGIIYLGDLDGEFYALNLTDGKQLWKHESMSGYLAGAAYQKGLVVVGDYDGLIHCFDANDGTEKWNYQTDSQIDAGPNFFEDSVLMTSEDGKLYSIGLSDGQLRWAYETGDQLRCSPTIADRKTFLGGCDGKLHIVDVTTGQAIGEGLPLEGPTGSTPSAIDHWVIVPTHSGTIFGIDAPSTERRWTFVDSERSQEIETSPAVHDGLAFVLTKNRRCLALKVADGTLVWEYVLKKPSQASPVVCDGRIWFGSSDGRLVALDEKTGKEVWQAEHQGKIKGSIAIADGRLVVATDRGSILCYGTQ
jgi:outer membrane protein assembly factor BamB